MATTNPQALTQTSTGTAATNTSLPIRIGALILIIGLGGGLLWSALAPLDEGVPTNGMVAIDTKRKPVQHSQGGIVREVLVREGSMVKEGDVLIRIDDVATRAGYTTMRQNYMSARSTESRLRAEQGNSAAIHFHPDILKAKADPLVHQMMVNQEQLFSSRRAALEAELAGIDESIQGSEAQLKSFQSSLEDRKSQRGSLQEELKGLRDLVGEGYAPRDRLLELERSASDNSASINELTGNILRAQRSIAEQKHRITQRRQEYRKEVETQLADVQRDVDSLASKLSAATGELGRVDIRSPAAGQVIGLAVQTPGAVIQAGQKLMDIVPEKETLLLETRVPPHLIDRVHPGMDVDARFSSFAHSPQLVVSGKVVSVSEDLLTPATQDAAPYYLARVAITKDGIKQLGHRVLQPGMPVEVVIKTGERTVLTYILHPLSKRLSASMKEE